MMVFKKAERRQAKLKIAVTGPSGSGKTYSALLLASGIGKKIAVVDTENGSASLYADRFEFDTVNLSPPYTIQKYIDAIKLAQSQQYDVLIIDSASHAWAGEGGLLAKKEALDQRGGNSFANWGVITKEQEQFKAILLNAQIHLICTMRSKQDYILEINDKGKSSPKKVGLAPVQREGMEYEFTTVFDVAMDHNAAISKDRTSLFDGQIFKITKDTGTQLMKWLDDAKPEIASQVEPQTLQERSNVLCSMCNAEVILHESKLGYICPNAKALKDGHTRFRLDELKERQQKNREFTTSEETQHES